MALGMRNSFLQVFFYAALFLSVFFITVILLLFSMDPVLEMSKNAQKHVFWFIYNNPAGNSLWNELSIVLFYLIGFVAFLRFKVLFRKTGSSELFFASIFIFSLLFEVFRFGDFFVRFLGWPQTVSLFFAKSVYFGRILGLLALFFSSLYILQMNYQKYNILVGIIALVSFALTMYVSFDTQTVLTDGLFKLGDEQGLFILLTSLKLLTIVNFVVAGLRRDAMMLLPAVVLFIVGRELMLFTPGPITLTLGCISLIAGIVLFDTKIKAMYYWV